MQLEFEPWLLLITLSAAAGLSLGALAARGRSKAWPLAARCLPSSLIAHEIILRDAALGVALLVPAELLALALLHAGVGLVGGLGVLCAAFAAVFYAMLWLTSPEAGGGRAAPPPPWLVKWIGRVGAAVAVWLALSALLLVILDSAAGDQLAAGPAPPAPPTPPPPPPAPASDTQLMLVAMLLLGAVLVSVATQCSQIARRLPLGACRTLADRGRARAAPFFTALADRGRALADRFRACVDVCTPPDWRRPGAAFARADRPKPAAVAPSLERRASRVEEKSDPLRLHNADLPKPRRGSLRATASSGALPEPPPPSLSAKHIPLEPPPAVAPPPDQPAAAPAPTAAPAVISPAPAASSVWALDAPAAAAAPAPAPPAPEAAAPFVHLQRDVDEEAAIRASAAVKEGTSSVRSGASSSGSRAGSSRPKCVLTPSNFPSSGGAAELL